MKALVGAFSMIVKSSRRFVDSCPLLYVECVLTVLSPGDSGLGPGSGRDVCGGEAHPRDPPRPRLRGAGGGGRHPPLQHPRLRRGAPGHRQLRRLVVLPGIYFILYM